MDFNPVHIHKVSRKTEENLLFLVIPILVFLAILSFLLAQSRSQRLANQNQGSTILGAETQTP